MNGYGDATALDKKTFLNLQQEGTTYHVDHDRFRELCALCRF